MENKQHYNKGRKQTPEHVAKRIKVTSEKLRYRKPWNKGFTGKEYKEHYKNGFGGIFKKGNVPPAKGKTFEEAFGKETAKKAKDKMRLAKLNNPTRYWEGKSRPEITGKNHPMWKEVKAPRTGKYTLEFKRKIRKEVLERDNFKSLVSGIKDDLVIHHIDFNQRNNNHNNLITVTRAENSMFNYRKEFYTWQLQILLHLEYGYEYPNLFKKINYNLGSV